MDSDAFLMMINSTIQILNSVRATCCLGGLVYTRYPPPSHHYPYCQRTEFALLIQYPAYGNRTNSESSDEYHMNIRNTIRLGGPDVTT